MRIKFIFTILALFLVVNFVSACSCMVSEDPKTELDKSAMVFEGKVLQISETNFNKQITFRVSKTWKGSAQQQLIVATPFDSAGCGFDFSLDEEYLVYAVGDSSNLVVNSCGRTNLLSLAKEDTKEFTDQSCICTMDAMACSDGSFVGRVCPDCSFAQCPNSNNTFLLSNGEKVEIKINRESALAVAANNLGESDFSVELKEINFEAVYELKTEKQTKLFGFISKKAEVIVYVRASSVASPVTVKKPWWAFLASGI